MFEDSFKLSIGNVLKKTCHFNTFNDSFWISARQWKDQMVGGGEEFICFIFLPNTDVLTT